MILVYLKTSLFLHVHVDDEGSHSDKISNTPQSHQIPLCQAKYVEFLVFFDSSPERRSIILSICQIKFASNSSYKFFSVGCWIES